MLACTFLFAVLACANAFTLQGLNDAEWTAFKLKYNKHFDDEVEEWHRFQIFNEIRLMITEHNMLYTQRKVSYELDINQFADMTQDEFLEYMGLNIPLPKIHKNGGVRIPFTNDLPESINWTAWGAVTPVKNQKNCNAGWAFATTGALEAIYLQNHNVLVSLSEQNLIDCAGDFGTNGCNNGTVEDAFAYVYYNGDLDTEDAYPYRGTKGRCHFKKRTKNPVTFTWLIEMIRSDDEDENENNLKIAVGSLNPATAAIDATSTHFRFYKGGIFDYPYCNKNRVNHAVLVVGYGSDNGQDYWLVKNSFGTTWGDEGYIKMSRNKQNQCGIASLASVPYTDKNI